MENYALIGAVTLSTLMGGSLDRNTGKAERTRNVEQAHASNPVDRFVPHVSTDRANKGDSVKLFLRERLPHSGAAVGPIVLFVQGRSAFTVPDFDLDYGDYSWMAYLAQAGFDVFAMDLQGYGGSSKPSVMDDPCNTSSANQTNYLVPNPLSAPCSPTYPHSFGSFRTDWDEMDTVVEFIRALRRDSSVKINLIGWSRGGMRVISYAALHPDKVDKVVAYAPTRFPPLTTDSPYPTNMTNKADSFINWDRQLDPKNCPNQFDPGIRDVIWETTREFDKLGSRWGTSGGIRRSPAFNSADGWTSELLGMVRAPTLVILGSLDDQGPEKPTRALYDALHSQKVYVTVSCGSHELVNETRHIILLDASAQWLKSGTYDGCSNGCSFVK
jgi:pimeloyl-ACP methyl ester carboxylesterase